MASEIVKNSLQSALVELIDLALLGKQAHWNLQGETFRSLHLHLDELVDELRAAYDEVAERLVALGTPADGRAGTIAQTSSIDDVGGGWLGTDKVIRMFDERLMAASENIKKNLPALEEDLLTQDLLIATAAGLEKQAWMFRSGIN